MLILAACSAAVPLFCFIAERVLLTNNQHKTLASQSLLLFGPVFSINNNTAIPQRSAAATYVYIERGAPTENKQQESPPMMVLI
jgi:hypothetical protein